MKLFPIKHPETGHDALCDDRCWPTMEAAGYSKDADDAAPAPDPDAAAQAEAEAAAAREAEAAEAEAAAAAPPAAQGQGEMRLADVGAAMKGQPKTLSVTQQVQGSGAAVASAQFTNDPSSGQWETCRAVGGGGAVECNAIQYDERNQSFEIDVVFHDGDAYVRVGAWADQGLTGPPLVASNADTPHPFGQVAAAPEPAPKRSRKKKPAAE